MAGMCESIYRLVLVCCWNVCTARVVVELSICVLQFRLVLYFQRILKCPGKLTCLIWLYVASSIM